MKPACTGRPHNSLLKRPILGQRAAAIFGITKGLGSQGQAVSETSSKTDKAYVLVCWSCCLGTKHKVVVGAGVAGIGGGGVVLGVGVCIRAGRLEGLGAGRGIVAWAVCVGAVGATVGVG